MNTLDKQYQELLKTILEFGVEKKIGQVQEPNLFLVTLFVII